MPKKTDIDTLILKMRERHGGKYGYDVSLFSGTHNKMRIICPEHGEFWQTPNKHLMGRGCPKCNGGVRLTTEEFVRKAKERHGDKYDYSKVAYINASTCVEIICREHGSFMQKPSLHLMGSGCPICGGSRRLTLEEFVEKARKVHGSKYDYSKVEYVNNSTEVMITCPKHGDFLQTPNHHMLGSGCPLCNSSRLEDNVARQLDEMHVKYIRHYRADWLGRQHLDFFIEEKNMAIECQGVQHFKSVEFFGGEEKLKYLQELDKRKEMLCAEHGIELKYVKFDDDGFVL